LNPSSRRKPPRICYRLSLAFFSPGVRPRRTCRRASRKVLGPSASASEGQHPDIASSGPAHRGEAWAQRGYLILGSQSVLVSSASYLASPDLRVGDELGLQSGLNLPCRTLSSPCLYFTTGRLALPGTGRSSAARILTNARPDVSSLFTHPASVGCYRVC